MITPSLLRSLNQQALIKSHPMSGVRSGPTNSFSVTTTPVDSLDPLLGDSNVLESPVRARQAYAYTQSTITTGMVLVVADREYNIKGVAPYPGEEGYTLYQLVLEDVVAK